MQIPLSQAHKYLTGISRSKTYADVSAGVLTATRDTAHGNKKMVSLAELERVYGKIRNPEDVQDSTETNGTDSNGHLITQFLEERIADLQAQLEKAEQRETERNAENKELREMLKNEQQRTLALQPPPKERNRNWLLKLIGA